jgi:anti-anti-sigma factor
LPKIEAFLKLAMTEKIILECSEVTFLSSARIKVLLSLTNLLKSRGGGLILLNLQESAKKVLRTSKTLDLFCHINDPKEAVRPLEGKKGSPSR